MKTRALALLALAVLLVSGIAFASAKVSALRATVHANQAVRP